MVLACVGEGEEFLHSLPVQHLPNFIETQPLLLLQPPQMPNKYHKSLDASHLLKKTLNPTEHLLMMDSIQTHTSLEKKINQNPK